MVERKQLEDVVTWMRLLGIVHLETPELKLTLTPEAPAGDDVASAPVPEDEADADESYRSVLEHPDTYGGFVPHIKRDKL